MPITEDDFSGMTLCAIENQPFANLIWKRSCPTVYAGVGSKPETELSESPCRRLRSWPGALEALHPMRRRYAAFMLTVQAPCGLASDSVEVGARLQGPQNDDELNLPFFEGELIDE